ncbi:cytochrome P450 [Bisporella sp. PMI_857]|nr:cytochrome P450 [Bisporella sp. PMI_857]
MDGSAIGNWLLKSTLLIAAWLLSVVIYRLFFHPLANYPGPFWAKITDWYSVYHCLTGNRHLEFYRIHQKYGKFVRYGPNRLSVNSATGLKAIYGPKTNSQKSGFYEVLIRFFPAFSSQSIIDEKKFLHAEKRKTLSHALHQSSTAKGIDDAILNNLDILCSNLITGKNDDWSGPVNISNVTAYFSFDIMGEVCFGRRVDMQNRTENRHMLNTLSQATKGLALLGHMQKLLSTGLHKVPFVKLLKQIDGYREYSRLECDRALDNKSAKPYVFQHLLSAKKIASEEPLFTYEELVSECSLLIIAGSDTSSTCLATTIFYLLHNPACYSRVQGEVRSKFTTESELRNGGERVKDCTYMRACIDESLRMAPPVGSQLPREVLPGGMVIDEHHISAGTEVGTPIYTIHHNETYYPDPFTYNPDRWIADTEGHAEKNNASLKKAESAFCPFSVGARSCVGKDFAYHEVTTTLARLLWAFDMKLAEGRLGNLGGGCKGMGRGRERAGEYQQWDVFTSTHDGPMIHVRKRIVDNA